VIAEQNEYARRASELEPGQRRPCDPEAKRLEQRVLEIRARLKAGFGDDGDAD
jgi:hypothetical protein